MASNLHTKFNMIDTQADTIAVPIYAFKGFTFGTERNTNIRQRKLTGKMMVAYVNVLVVMTDMLQVMGHRREIKMATRRWIYTPFS